MTLPALNAEGFLPPGVHVCTWDEIGMLFVDSAPNAADRQLLQTALDLFVIRAEQILPQSTYWIDGGFATHKASSPFDVDVMVVAKNGAWSSLMKTIDAEHGAVDAWNKGGRVGPVPKCPTATTFHGLRTHQNLLQQVPGGAGQVSALTPRIQPFGGMIDGFFAPRQNKLQLDSFRRDWMLDRASGCAKGFLEVKPNGH